MRLVVSKAGRNGVVAHLVFYFREIEKSNIAVPNQVVDCEEGVSPRIGGTMEGSASLDPDV